MTNDDIVERVARAINDGLLKDKTTDEIARAAIAAMREPQDNDAKPFIRLLNASGELDDRQRRFIAESIANGYTLTGGNGRGSR